MSRTRQDFDRFQQRLKKYFEEIRFQERCLEERGFEERGFEERGFEERGFEKMRLAVSRAFSARRLGCRFPKPFSLTP